MTPISRRSGPRMKPPPEPSRPPTQPPRIPQSAQKAMWMAVHRIVASQMASVLPAHILFLCSRYSFAASYPNTPTATGNCRETRNTAKWCNIVTDYVSHTVTNESSWNRNTATEMKTSALALAPLNNWVKPLAMYEHKESGELCLIHAFQSYL